MFHNGYSLYCEAIMIWRYGWYISSWVEISKIKHHTIPPGILD